MPSWPTLPTTQIPPSPDTTPLGDETHEHTPHHQEIDDALTLIQSAVGKVVASGYNFGGYGASPTLFDPSKTTFDQGGFFQFNYLANVLVAGALTGQSTGFRAQGESTDGNHQAFITFTAVAPDNSGVGGSSSFALNSSDFAGEIFFTYDASTAQAAVIGQSGQTSALLDIETSSAAVFKVMGDAKIGVFGQTPAVQPTGVAVSAAGIHAALVTLGWITA